MITSPFPYKLTANSEVKEGLFSDLPKFCRLNHQGSKCKQFYLNLATDKGLFRCPYGFCSEKCKIGDSEIILTCLNVEHISDRKEMQRRVKDTEFVPRLSQKRYKSLKSFMINSEFVGNEEFAKAQESAKISNEKEALANVIHELKNMINQLTSRTDKLSDACQSSYKDYSNIESLSTNIYALTNLMNVRISSYNLEVEPNKIDSSEKIEMCIYKKVEKAYKCLQQAINDKRLRVTLRGNSYNLFYANSILEIGLFIILENAIKYAPNGTEISVVFNEKNDNLVVKFTNWGIRPNSGELNNLTKRGFRSQRVLDYKNIKGRGIGLYLLAIICNMQKVKLNIEVGKDTHAFNQDGYVYAPFVVTLEFNKMRIVENDEMQM